MSLKSIFKPVANAWTRFQIFQLEGELAAAEAGRIIVQAPMYASVIEIDAKAAEEMKKSAKAEIAALKATLR